MLKLIDRILQQFRICFKREETFSWFVIIVVGILIRPDTKGVSSIVGCLSLAPAYYESMLHFFRSQAYDLRCIKSKWHIIVLEHIKPVLMENSIIMIGDHIKVAKEARRMPGVKKLHQDENVGKAEYIFGHQFGMVDILAEGKTPQCVPLDIELQDGIDEINCLKNGSSEAAATLKKKKKENTSILKMLHMSANFVKSNAQKAIILLDAYFKSCRQLFSAS